MISFQLLCWGAAYRFPNHQTFLYLSRARARALFYLTFKHKLWTHAIMRLCVEYHPPPPAAAPWKNSWALYGHLGNVDDMVVWWCLRYTVSHLYQFQTATHSAIALYSPHPIHRAPPPATQPKWETFIKTMPNDDGQSCCKIKQYLKKRAKPPKNTRKKKKKKPTTTHNTRATANPSPEVWLWHRERARENCI